MMTYKSICPLCFALLIALVFPLGSVAAAAEARDEQVTYNKDVAPILWKNCANCHRAGEVGPFSLLTYDDAAKRAEFIRDVIQERVMPPWRAEPDFGKFHGSRRLADNDVKTIARWVAAGTPEGRKEDLPEPPKFTEGWQLGTPDIVLKMPEPFEVPADTADIYRCFVIPIDTKEDRTVAAVEFRPGNRRVVHHAVFFLDHSGQAREKDEGDPGQGYTSFGGPGFIPNGGLGGWAPGCEPVFLAEGLGKYLRAQSDLVMQVHYHASGKVEQDQSQVGIYFTKKPVEHIVTGVSLLDPRLNIPAGEKRHEMRVQATLPVDVTAIGVFPHMHLIGREMKVWAETPDEKTVPLIWIKDWNFNWQDQYAFAEPLRLEKGTKIKLVAYYDNSSDNPSNPNQPPKRVRWGEETTDEMCLCTLQVYTDTLEDMRELYKMPHGRIGAALGGGSLPESTGEKARRAIKSFFKE
jgi:hypothetical protein